ncbi:MULTISPECIES: prolyl oligopeptidase family serine peptidase [Gammaproteobacteria]|uniref:S9 family peptidase n=1 Tax=Gammaproteobacteria TaxID=1236 RepID=UPI000DCFDE9B|nr:MULTISPECIES: prolyl oligopeptidase family serine peptidase [Gammaproteobacteria]RTE87149.1 S9 family peptidase [Aliidiomarina sp. B3213]TCZ93063.1 S9 family peptidase [Lysobacter sp. N42]
MKKSLSLAVAAALFTVSCASVTEPQTNSAPVVQSYQTEQATHSQTNPHELTLEQIMAHPDWIGNAPENPFWSFNGEMVLYTQKEQGSPVRRLQHIGLNESHHHMTVPLAHLHRHAHANAVYNSERTLAAYTFEGNVFVYDLENQTYNQLTQDRARKTDVQFLNNGQIAFRSGNEFYTLDPVTGQQRLLVSFVTQDKPVAVSEPSDYLAREELDLIEYNRVQRQERQQRADYQNDLVAENSMTAPEPIYLGSGVQIAEVSLAPSGDRLIIATEKPQGWRGEGDLMPRYVTESGRIEMQNVRRRVADAKPSHHDLHWVDLNTGEVQPLSYETLPGFDEDVLQAVREENYAARGEVYESERKPRNIEVLPGWAAGQDNIEWTANGEQVAVLLRSWDNKDRWIATVNFESSELVSEHRLHDEAWTNNRAFNDLGWLDDGETLWYSSEESGYGHLYRKDMASGDVTALTSGSFIVDEVVLSENEDYFYFHANKPHPGVYEIYRVSVNGGDLEQLTNLGGISTFVLSPDESQLLISNSQATRPTELFVQDNSVGAQARQITETVSEDFAEIAWQAPEIVAVPSSHGEHPIYSRVYYPDNFDAEKAEQYPAVVFIHGAGYLQNAHAGWSNYFREYMFHNLLTQKGYVVLDLDYRGSRGYGRDWRTAIYRQMGTPEVEDLVDVVNYMSAELNVDAERVGTYGGSYGGFLTLMALFKEPGVFQAGAALRLVSDWATYNTGYTSNILNLPQEDTIAYRRSSPIYFAEGLEDSLLISAPMVDDNVFFQDSVRLVQRLIELEKQDFETAIFPVEPHGFVQPSSWLNQYRRILKLFEDNLHETD